MVPMPTHKKGGDLKEHKKAEADGTFVRRATVNEEIQLSQKEN